MKMSETSPSNCIRAAILLGAMLGSNAAQADPVVVVDSGDSSTTKCTLRSAVQAIFNKQDYQGCKYKYDLLPLGVKAHRITFSGVSNVLLKSEVHIPVPMTIDGGGKVSISGGGKNRIFYAGLNSGVLTLTGIEFFFGRGDGLGGAILVPNNGANVFIKNSKFNQNSVKSGPKTGSGGAIATFTKTSFEDVQFYDNVAQLHGGAVWGSDLVFKNSRFYRNRAAYGGGGAIHCTSGSLAVLSSHLYENAAGGHPEGPEGNQVSVYGGGAIMSGCNTQVELSTFEDNKIAGYVGGGAVYLTNGADGSVISRSKIHFNRTVAGIDIDDADGNPLYPAIWGSGAGGGLYISADTTISRSEISNNYALGHHGGGGIRFGESSTSRIANSAIHENYVADSLSFTPYPGGGISAWDADVEIVNSTINANWGTGELYAGLDSDVTLQNSVIVGKNQTCEVSGGLNSGIVYDLGGNLQYVQASPAAGDCGPDVKKADPQLAASSIPFTAAGSAFTLDYFRALSPQAQLATPEALSACALPPVSGVDIAGGPRGTRSCTSGAAEASIVL